MEFTKLNQALNDAAEFFIEKYRERIDDGGNNASGNLRNTIEAVVEADDLHYKISFNIAGYYKYVANGGGPGAWVPFDKMMDWLTVKRILPPEGYTLERFAYAIQHKIFKEGSKGYREGRPNYFQETQNETISNYENILQEALYDDVVSHIDELINKYIS